MEYREDNNFSWSQLGRPQKREVELRYCIRIYVYKTIIRVLSNRDTYPQVNNGFYKLSAPSCGQTLSNIYFCKWSSKA